MDTEALAACMEALGKPVRLEIFRLLVRAGRTGMSFGQIQERLGVPGSTLSHHVAALVRAGWVRQERVGREVRSYAVFECVRTLTDFLQAECCSLEAELERAEASEPVS